MLTIDLMGDPHLAKSFVHGVPLHRRGEREEMVWQAFAVNLAATKADLHVCLGDLFDRAIVPYDAILRAADVYLHTAAEKPETQFIILRGNHDLLRDLERASAFDLFARLVASADNVTIVTDPVVVRNHLFVGYDPVTPLADRITEDHRGALAAFFHADTTGFGSNTNLIPLQKLASLGIDKVFNGHEHKATEFTRDGVDVTVFGSLQPFAHGEESDDTLYVTLPLAELNEAGDLQDKCVRILLAAGETVDQEIDCLQLTVKRVAEAAAEAEEVTLGEFDIEALFRRAFEDARVSDTLSNTMLQRFHDRRLSREA
ncbi:DNA repair exonuclease SbcCD nuclease subunit [Sulfitobacter brevis]|uniref:DNA repair exonuclease SbcCD nuclease subunit n=2 Tax=Sulfitobacter brevis TaxID=74348 RepID=A0A1I1UIG9_9RHOB|nr:DNA repair exonuclease SbcCD nuclease subunit [Sulfitobacter brevis]